VYGEWGRFWQGVGEDRRGQEWGKGVVHVGGEEITEVVHCTRPGLKVGQCAVTSLAASLNEAVDIKSVNVVEEGSIFQGWGQGSMVCEVATDSQSKVLSFPRLEAAREEHWTLFRNGFLI